MNQKYLQEAGFLPFDEADCICIGCEPQFVDKRNTNKQLEQEYLLVLGEHEQKKLAAQEEAKKNKNKVPPNKLELLPKNYCLIANVAVINFSVSVSVLRSDCLAQSSVKTKMEPFFWLVWMEHVSVLLGFVHGKCSLAYSLNAAQEVTKTKQQLLDDNAIELQEQIFIQQSRSTLAGLMSEATTQLVYTAVANSRTKPFVDGDSSDGYSYCRWKDYCFQVQSSGSSQSDSISTY
jgi:hypothetical protein